MQEALTHALVPYSLLGRPRRAPQRAHRLLLVGGGGGRSYDINRPERYKRILTAPADSLFAHGSGREEMPRWSVHASVKTA
jgi:hypothetical protein